MIPHQNNIKLKTVIKTVFIILCLFKAADALASDSLTYSIASRMIDATEHFSLSLFAAISGAYRPLYASIATIGLLLILSKFLLSGVAPLREMMSFTLAMLLSSALAFDVDLFKIVVYDTFFDTLYRFDQFIIQSSASNMPGVVGVSFNNLEGMFKTIDAGLMGISGFAFEVAKDNEGLAGSIALYLEGLIIYLLYLFVSIYFLVIFTISIFGAHMMIIAMPITLSLYPFQKFRHYASNCISGMFHYGLVTIFACVAISLIVFISNDLVIEANQLRDAAIATDQKLKIPSGFLTASIMIGFLSIFIIKVSTEFASRVLNSATSQLGGAFPMIVAGTTTLAKGSVAMTKHVAIPAAAKAAGAAAYSYRAVNKLRGK